MRNSLVKLFQWCYLLVKMNYFIFNNNVMNQIKIMLTDCDRETSKKKDFRNR